MKTRIHGKRFHFYDLIVLSIQNKMTNKGGLRFRFKSKWQTSHETAFVSKQNQKQEMIAILFQSEIKIMS
ncbi:MAG TPA: hypothetical protein VFC69_04700 [Dysgonamonadaceae bacterium]|nr:hypothetical protein [Dysgonamonadaceae bacterium]